MRTGPLRAVGRCAGESAIFSRHHQRPVSSTHPVVSRLLLVDGDAVVEGVIKRDLGPLALNARLKDDSAVAVVAVVRENIPPKRASAEFGSSGRVEVSTWRSASLWDDICYKGTHLTAAFTHAWKVGEQ